MMERALSNTSSRGGSLPFHHCSSCATEAPINHAHLLHLLFNLKRPLPRPPFSSSPARHDLNIVTNLTRWVGAQQPDVSYRACLLACFNNLRCDKKAKNLTKKFNRKASCKKAEVLHEAPSVRLQKEQKP